MGLAVDVVQLVFYALGSLGLLFGGLLGYRRFVLERPTQPPGNCRTAREACGVKGITTSIRSFSR
jgi:hypothetical protein